MAKNLHDHASLTLETTALEFAVRITLSTFSLNKFSLTGESPLLCFHFSFIEASVTGLQSTQVPAIRISAVRAVYE